MQTHYDVAVIGLGAAGSAALNALARSGVRAIGIDRFDPPHDRGSSHGETRLLRTAYAEGPFYVPLVKRAVALWRAAERRTGATLFEHTGVVYAGPGGNPFLDATRLAAELGQVRLTPARGLDRWFDLPKGWHALREAGGGFVYPERAIRIFLAEARRHGATVLRNCACESMERSGGLIVLRTPRGTIEAKRVVATTGAWIAELMPELTPATFVERRVLHWFADPDHRFTRAKGFTPFAIGTGDGQMFYGFPANAKREVKIGEHLSVQVVGSPDAVDRRVRRSDIDAIMPLVRRFMLGLGPRLRSSVCMYPMAHDERFILAKHPGDPRVVVGAGLSGHGFKFAPALGEALANLARDRPQKVDIRPFGWPVPIRP
ncbi:MAG TPA: N-methyl-L-tryptophan oxidase [Rhizomicrobium sp.]|nr:N-methyl-L-tryptophan oxidase [Rhizomicrobium sp.]